MKIICKKDILLKCMRIVSKATKVEKSLPMLRCVLLKATLNDFKLISGDLELYVESKLENTNIIEEGAVVIEAKSFLKMVKNLPDDYIEISSDEDNVILFRCSNFECKVQGKSSEMFSVISPIRKDIGYTIEQYKLKDMIEKTVFSVSTDKANKTKEEKASYLYELLEIKDGFINLVSIDGFRVSFRQNPLVNPIRSQNNSANMSRKSVNILSKMLTNKSDCKVSIYFANEYILFDLGDTSVMSKLTNSNFVEYEQIFYNNYKTEITINKKILLNSLNRLILLLKGVREPVILEIKYDELKIDYTTALGESHETLKIITKGDNIRIAFNPRYLIDALEVIEEDEIRMTFLSEVRPCIIKPVDYKRTDYKYLILPIRLAH